MARRKNAAALFEVIHADNRFPRRHGSGGGWSLRTPRSWFGFGQRGPSAGDAGDAPVPVETIEYEAPRPRGPSLLARAFALLPSVPRVGLTLDPERQLVRFQMSYTGALVSAFTLVVAVALAYLVGRQTSHRPLPALSEQTTEELRNGPAYAEVLDVHNDDEPPLSMAVGAVPAGGRAAAPAAPAPSRAANTTTLADANAASSRTTVAPGARQAQQTQAMQGVRPSQLNQPQPPDAFMVTDAERMVGLQYVLVQSYPEQERELAESAVKTLNEHGVLCTVVRGLPYAPTWYCVVGITGFARVKDVPEYDAYVARIQQISDKFAGTSRFKKFDPKPLRWRKITVSPTTEKSKPAPTPKQ